MTTVDQSAAPWPRLHSSAAAAPALGPGLSVARHLALSGRLRTGRGTDIISRLLAPILQEELGQYRWWSRTAPAPRARWRWLAMSRARPDGYTMLMTTISASAWCRR